MKIGLSYSIIARNKRLVGRWNMLEKIIELTNEYIESMPKKERKKYGQFFTSMETARFMAGLYNIDEKKSKVSVLDAGAGSGILSCAFIERLEMIDSIQKIELTCYENDNNVLPLLKRNLEYCKEKSGKKIVINIIEDNYILSQQRCQRYATGHRICILFLLLWDCLIYVRRGKWYILFLDHGHPEHILNASESIS